MWTLSLNYTALMYSLGPCVDIVAVFFKLLIKKIKS